MSNARRVLSALFVICGTAMARADDAGSMPSHPDWQIVVQPADPYSGQSNLIEGYWIGLRSLAGEPRLVCLQSVLWSSGSSSRRRSVAGFSRGPCTDPSGANRVLPGETLYVWGGVRRRVEVDAAAPLRFDVTAKDFRGTEAIAIAILDHGPFVRQP